MSKVYYNGIDTSKWQNSQLDYYKAKQNGIDFVFLRIGYNKTKDKCFEQDYISAIKAGLKVGVYFYPLSTTPSEAIADATRVLGWLNNRHLDFPVVYDIEDAKHKKLDKSTLSWMYNDFRNKIECNGVYDCMLYTGESFFNNYFNKALIRDDIWIAKYSALEPQVNKKVSIWQYTSAYQESPYYVGKLDKNYMLVDKFYNSGIAVENYSDNPYPEPTRILKYVFPLPYMKGNDVKWLQYALYERDLMTEKDIDGVFGNKTKEKLIEYQKSTHSLKVDGILGSATIYSLKYC